MKVIDFHCDVLYKARQAARKGTPLCFEKNDNQIDLQKLAKGDYLLQCFAAFVYMENNQDPLLYAMEEIDEFYRMLAEYPDHHLHFVRPRIKCARRQDNRLVRLFSV